MLVLLKGIADQTAETNNYIGEGMVRQLRGHLANLPANASDLTRWHLHTELGEAELRLGNEQAAIDQLTQAGRLLPRLQGKLSALMANQTLFRLGVAHMRHGETQNCCPDQNGTQSNPDSCILPLRDGGIHTQQEGSLQAITYLTEVLRNTTVELPLHLEARWLLNIAYMTVGGYPEQVPKPYLLPPDAFQSTEEMPRFTNIAPHLGLDTFDLSGGAIVDDFDNDNYLDLVVSTWDPAGQIQFFRNNRDGTFSEQTEQAGLLGMYGGLNLLQADYDNDVDILVLRGAWLESAGQHPNSLLRNNGDGTFTDVTFDAGLGEVHYPTQTASWGDYDNDGDLDLYIGNESTQAFNAPCQLFRNNGDGTFSDVAAEAGVQNNSFTKSVIWGDYNADRFPDLYVSNFKGANRLYRNNSNGTFTDVEAELNIDLPMRSFPAWFWDFDNDGILDLYVSAYSAGISHLAANALGIPIGAPPSAADAESQRTYHNRPDLSEDGLAHLYHGDGRGRFEEVGRQYNIVQPNAPMGSNFGDLDNDGYLDFYLGTGYPNYKNLMPSVMYRNRRGIDFVDVTYAGGFGHLQKGHAVVFADLDNDGRTDIYVANDTTSNFLYRNAGNGRFVDIGPFAGAAYNEHGVAEGGMGVDFGDYNNDGALDIFVTNFSNETNTLYHNTTDGALIDFTNIVGLGEVSFLKLAFGTKIFDANNDGTLDLFVANGHLYPTESDALEYAQTDQLFINTGEETFADASKQAGEYFTTKRVGRGAAFGDYNNDGDTDIFVVNLNQEGVLLRNEGGNKHNWLMIKTVGVKSNRDGIGARIEVATRSRSQIKEVQTGSSYLSGHDLRLIFGLGTEKKAESVKITWPSGAEQTLVNVEANQLLVITEEISVQTQ